MADLERPLAALVDPPLASPPPLAEIEDRARRHRARRRIGSGAGAALAVVALIAGVITLTPADESTVHTAANGSSDGGNVAGPALGQRQPFPESATVHEFDANGVHWRVLAMRQLSGGICLGLARGVGTGTTTVSPPCWTQDDRPIQAAAMTTGDLSYVFGIAAKSVTEVAIKEPAARAEIFGQAAGYPVNFFGSVIPSGTSEVDLRALFGNHAPFLLSVTVHGRIDTFNGQVAAPAVPTTTVVPGQIPPAAPATTAPPTTVAQSQNATLPTVISPPTTAPPLLGIPKLVSVTLGASNLTKITFESAVASGSQALAVRFWSGVEPCTVLGKVDVVESADKVTVTLWTGTTNALILCTALAQYFETIVPLSAPLGARVVVDGAA
ncbi:MAG: hypothetical protein ACRD2W_06810 [Acidimicrobiales bacterium]